MLGQTGAGKTYTMFGESDDAVRKGMIPRAVELILERVQSDDVYETVVGCSFLEIYNEKVRDLAKNFTSVQSEVEEAGESMQSVFAEMSAKAVSVAESINSKTTHEALLKKYDIRSMDYEIFQTSEGYTYVKDLTILKISSVKHAMSIVNFGLRLRETHETCVNRTSSRSHTIFTIRVIKKHKGTGDIISSSFNLIDLAGSERLNDTNSEGSRLKEEIHINSSLSALSRVIMSLGAVDATHIPYRDSKLTRILQNSLSGNCYTVIIAHITPYPLWHDECLSTLRFASGCYHVHNEPHVNHYASVAEAARDWEGISAAFSDVPPEAPKPEEEQEPLYKLIARVNIIYISLILNLIMLITGA
jgi:kinesin family protein 5